jgi:hypothetical protein
MACFLILTQYEVLRVDSSMRYCFKAVPFSFVPSSLCGCTDNCRSLPRMHPIQGRQMKVVERAWYLHVKWYCREINCFSCVICDENVETQMRQHVEYMSFRVL